MTPTARPPSPLRDWLVDLGWGDARCEALAGDVSPRRYFRLRSRSQGGAVAALYPAAVGADCGRFLTSTGLLQGVGVRVPAVLAADCDRGLMLVEDVGERTLYDLGSTPGTRLAFFFRRAAELVPRIASVDPAAAARLNPPLDEELLRRELQRTLEVFLEPRALIGSAALGRELEAALAELCRRLAAQPARPCHRDFMVRNLVPLEGPPALAVLDHQGLRLGPAAYDLASLLNDSLFLPATEERALLAEHASSAEERLAYHRAAAQRTLKAVGTYAAFAAQGSPRHEPLIPPTLERALHHLSRCPETRRLAPTLTPLLALGEHPPPDD